MRFYEAYRPVLKRGSPCDDNSIAQQMRALALSLPAERKVRVRSFQPTALIQAGRAIQSIIEEMDEQSEALRWLGENHRIVAQLISELATPSGVLPAVGRKSRVEHIAQRMLSEGEALLTKDRLLAGMIAFDEVRPLRMAELWAFPSAAARSCGRLYCYLCRQAINSARAAMRAAEWVHAESVRMLPSSPDSAFLEQACKLLHEEEQTERMDLLVKTYGLEKIKEEVAVEHEQQTILIIFLQNLLSTLRTLKEIRWDQLFPRLSRTERLLLQDPSGTYANMDAQSQSVVRGIVAQFALRADIHEHVVAQAALTQAQKGEGIQREITHWLYTDEGLRSLSKALGTRMHPVLYLDPDGTKRIIWILCCFFLLAAAAASIEPRLLWGIPLFYGFASHLVNRTVLNLVHPRPLLRLRMDSVPGHFKTLVVMPVLLSGEKRAEELAEQLETLGAAEFDPNIDFLLLADLPDSKQEETDEDDKSVRKAKEVLRGSNDRAGREKYFFLHRRREFFAPDHRYMARERKRGALEDLNELLCGGKNAFMESFCRRYSFVLTLDAGGRMLPTDIHRLIGTIAHPLNRRHVLSSHPRGYSLLAPRIQLAADQVSNLFIRLYGGEGGVDPYPSHISDVYQDTCGKGIYSGKGIYDVRAFREAMHGQLPSGRILSHDLIEGLLAGAGQVNDVPLYDGHPRSVHAWLSRLDRWTRGDWQLIGWAIGCTKQPGIDGLGRFKLCDNLLRSLSAPAQLMCILLSFLLGDWKLLLLSTLPYLQSFPKKKEDWHRIAVRLILLPLEAWITARAILKALFRLFISHRHLLDWTTADDAERNGGSPYMVFSYACAFILLAFAARHPLFLLPALILGGCWLLIKRFINQLEKPQTDAAPEYSDNDRDVLLDLAKRTWQFFRDTVGVNGLPPDNEQTDPPIGLAKRTSPTNIGLYLLSCLSAQRLGIIEPDERDQRLEETLMTVEQLPKWKGHLYNWYDTDNGHPLSPRYVSSVDSGNLAACLMLMAQAVPKFAVRFHALARQMDFTALYDPVRELFFIGMDEENNRMSASHYDLLASEARILSYTAIMLGQVPCRHWQRLNRAACLTDHGSALLSWSGTMFEYLMPELFMPTWQGTMLRQTRNCVLRAQRSSSVEGLPFGVSESGYYAFDRSLSYQYRAFGLPELALRGDQMGQVIAPYASILALPFIPEAVLDNLRKMIQLGLMDTHGLFEALDFSTSRMSEGTGHRIVRSHMAHHQGMVLASICNALTGMSISIDFMRIPQAKGLALLLQEKPLSHAKERDLTPAPTPHRIPQREQTARKGIHGLPWPDTHLLAGEQAFAMVTSDGEGTYSRAGILANRPARELGQGRSQGFFLTLFSPHRKTTVLPMEGKVRMEMGYVEWMQEAEEIEVRVRMGISPEDGSLIQETTMKSTAREPLEWELTSAFEVALAREADYSSHPVFQNLFVDGGQPEPGTLVFRRNPRKPQDRFPALIHTLRGTEPEDALSFETDLNNLAGRCGDLKNAAGTALNGTLGFTLNPASVLRARMMLQPGEGRSIAIFVALTDAPDRFLRGHRSVMDAARALELAQSRAATQARFLSLTPKFVHMAHRAAVLLYFQKTPGSEPQPPWDDFSARTLWTLGLPGDRPILAVCISEEKQLPFLRDVLRLHEFYLESGLKCDLAVLVDDGTSAYIKPLRDQILAAFSAVRLTHPADGKAIILDKGSTDPLTMDTLRAFAAVWLDGQMGPLPDQISDALFRRNRAAATKPPEPSSSPAPDGLWADNGFGGFEQDGYLIYRHPTPAPWVNILAGRTIGCLVTERGGICTWFQNSRNGRLTPFGNDALQEDFSEALMINGERLVPERCLMQPGRACYSGCRSAWGWQMEVCCDTDLPLRFMTLHLTNHSTSKRAANVSASIHWRLGPDLVSGGGTVCGIKNGIYWARGDAGALAAVCFDSVGGELSPDGFCSTGMPLRAGETKAVSLTLACADTFEEAEHLLRSCITEERTQLARGFWKQFLSSPMIDTPDPLINTMVNRWLPAQVLSSRVWGRTGYYQGGGAYGFRDQLQDMICLIPRMPQLVREHLILCAAHQFESGDVQHWWHPPRTGVRTNIRDDLLFLPYVTARYVHETGDESVLFEPIPYLRDAPIPTGQADLYMDAEESGLTETLQEHCLRALDRAYQTGAHGLLLMGGGDWNDGMNGIGAKGRGESVWLSEFYQAVVREYHDLCPADTQAVLDERRRALHNAVEQHGWDGAWYLRAYDDEGRPIGGAACKECRIDLLSQSWAVLSGQDPIRARGAMEQALSQLWDKKHGILRLLTPPFKGNEPGYIGAYPPGIRENGGQYTHAACWAVIALAHLGLSEEAWSIFRMLMPYSHSDTPEKAALYRVEPYVMAGDIAGEAPHTGRGGWTWYTGAANWMLEAAYRALLGLSIRRNTATLSPLLPRDWDEACVMIHTGGSRYTLVASRLCDHPELDGQPASAIPLLDDGREHTARFPLRAEAQDNPSI